MRQRTTTELNMRTTKHSHPNMTGDQMFKKFENPRWQMAAILKIEKSRYLQNRLANFH